MEEEKRCLEGGTRAHQCHDHCFPSIWSKIGIKEVSGGLHVCMSNEPCCPSEDTGIYAVPPVLVLEHPHYLVAF